ncbi:PAS domain S-box protein [Ancylomarina euxinus]|uniref:histidine kinase n=1 Tax=Ancylomarina euxinus TaxID=2283627 RepID=A0A425Y098_9BACT|nr:PAS domain S-box protein [Ancylomarina euxinus]MCZ4695226.1 PAS domain S-box protein [Ancylomarina euxinus]MUP15423.1 PAS domain S-box protein [Ancylomarina euxinus]RRG21133.1 PAS domain S-box protein [Ancylomarina euxinus]
MKILTNWKTWLLFVVSLFLTCLASFFIKSEIDKKNEAEFIFECNEITSKINLRLHAHAQLLRSGAALFSVSDTVTRETWSDYIKKSKVDSNLPGILGTGFSLLVQKTRLEQHIQQIRNEGFSDYKVWPESHGDTSTAIIFLEPFSQRNIRAFGFDMMSESVRREAMERARDLDIAALSGKVLLVQETKTDVQAGSLMYVPVYQKGAAINTIEQRRSAIVGWVYSPYRMTDLMLGILDKWELKHNRKTFYLHIFDEKDCSSQSLLFESHKIEEQEESENIRFSLNVPIDFNGHQWTLVFSQKKENFIIDYIISWTVLIGGLIISILLLLLTNSMLSTKRKAQKIAATLTSELKENERLLKESQEIAHLGTYSLDLKTGVWKSSEILDAIFGIDKNYTHSIEGWSAIIHPDYRELMLDYFQNEVIAQRLPFNKEYKITRLYNKDERWVHGLGKLEFDSNDNPIRLIGTISDITEQKLAREQLNLSREQYRSLFENSPLGIYQTTPEGKVLNANQALLKMLEFDSLSELQSRDLAKEGYSQDSNITRKQFVDIIERDGYVTGLEENWTTKNGKVIPIRENARVVKGNDGKVLFYEGTVENITERKKAELEIQNITNRLKLATSAANIGIWDLDVINNVLFWDDSMYKLYGISSKTFLGAYEAWEAGLHPDDLLRGREEIQMALKGEKEFDTEFRVLWPDKSVHYIKANGFVTHDVSGKPIRILGTNMDITDRKLAEKQIRLSQERYSIAVEGSNDGIWDWNTVTNDVFFSPPWKSMLGYDDEELENNFNTWETLLHPDDYERALSTIQSYFNNEILEYEVEFRMQHKDGTYRWILSKGKALRDENGKPYRMAGSHSDITSRKLAEEEINRLSEHNQLILNSIGEGIYGLDLEGRMTFVNPAAAVMIGKPVEELIGKQSHAGHHHTHLDGSQYPHKDCLIHNVFRTGVESHVDNEVFWRADDTSFPVEYICTPIKNDSGNLIGAVVVFKDITERKKAEKDLKESEKRLRSIIETSPVPMVISKLSEGIIVMANESFGKLFKISLLNVIGQKTPDFYANPDDRKKIVKKLIKDGFINNYEIVLKKLDGELFWGSVSLKLMTLDNEQVLIAGFHDITEMKNAEEEIMKHREHLEEMVSERTRDLTISQKKLQQSLRDITDYKFALDESSLVAITDNKGIIIYANDIFCRTSQYSREELIGNTHRIINSAYHSSDFFIDLWRTISMGKVWRGEVKNKAKDGSFNWVDSTIVPFLDEQGKPYQYVSVRFDITEKKLSEEDLIKAKEVADSANRAKSEFLANMSHEIRTPMNAVIGFSDLLSKTVKDEKQRSQVESIRSSGKNLLKIINDILDLSKIEAGKIDIIPVPINLYSLISEIENMFAPKVNEKKIEFSIEYESAIPQLLLLDEIRLRQILFNLIGNALKFTDKGHVILTVDVHRNLIDNYDLILHVEDTGIGIPISQQELIFEPFSQQAGQNSKYGGTGLGLSITKKLIENMGGTISLESKVDKGSNFKITIPNIPALTDQSEIHEDKFDHSATRFDEARILLVDDNAENRNLIKDLLEHSQLTVFEATNGEEAIVIAKEHQPDLILMDLRMPVMDGYEATRILKNTKSTKSIPIIAISASTRKIMNGDRSKTIFDEFLMKPLDAADLFVKMKKYLNHKSVVKTVDEDADTLNIALTDEQLQNLPELIATLENSFIPTYMHVSNSQMIDEIEEFGKDLQILAKNSQIKPLLNHATDICSLADNFEIEKLLKTLGEFPKIIAQLKTYIHN